MSVRASKKLPKLQRTYVNSWGWKERHLKQKASPWIQKEKPEETNQAMLKWLEKKVAVDPNIVKKTPAIRHDRKAD